MKKKLLALLMGTSLVFALAACGGDDEATDDGDTGETTESTDSSGVDAEQVFSQSCAACHGGDLTGGVGPDISKVGSNLSSDEIKTIILEGRGAMPAQNLDDAEATAVADWLAAKK